MDKKKATQPMGKKLSSNTRKAGMEAMSKAMQTRARPKAMNKSKSKSKK